MTHRARFEILCTPARVKQQTQAQANTSTSLFRTNLEIMIAHSGRAPCAIFRSVGRDDDDDDDEAPLLFESSRHFLELCESFLSLICHP